MDQTAGRSPVASKKLQFGSIQIYEMPMELGNHPPPAGGAPVTIGWTPISKTTTSVDCYELLKQNDEKQKHGRQKSTAMTRLEKEIRMRLSAQERSSILWRAGYLVDDILYAEEEAEETIQQRKESYALSCAKSNSFFERIKTGNLFLAAPQRKASRGGTRTGSRLGTRSL